LQHEKQVLPFQQHEGYCEVGFMPHRSNCIVFPEVTLHNCADEVQLTLFDSSRRQILFMFCFYGFACCASGSNTQY